MPAIPETQNLAVATAPPSLSGQQQPSPPPPQPSQPAALSVEEKRRLLAEQEQTLAFITGGLGLEAVARQSFQAEAWMARSQGAIELEQQISTLKANLAALDAAAAVVAAAAADGKLHVVHIPALDLP